MMMAHHYTPRSPSIGYRLQAALTPRPITLRNGETARESHPLHQRYSAEHGAVVINSAGYLHHSSVLVAALVECYLDPVMFARQYDRASARWTETCCCIWRMDGVERTVIAALAGEPAPNFDISPAPLFNAALRRLIARPTVAPFFALDPTQPDDGTHHSVRPVGYEHDDVNQLALITDRKALRALDLPERALVALITTAYGNEDLANRAFKGPGLALKTATAADALLRLPEDARRDALMLIAAYAGW